MPDPIPFPRAKRPAPVSGLVFSPSPPIRSLEWPALTPEQIQILREEFGPPADRPGLLAAANARPPRAILRATARKAYERGVMAARRQMAHREQIVTWMPGRWVRRMDHLAAWAGALPRRLKAWLALEGRRDVVFAITVGLCTLAALLSALGLVAGAAR